MARTREEVDAELAALRDVWPRDDDAIVDAQMMVLAESMSAGQVSTYFRGHPEAVMNAALEASYWLTGAMGPGYPSPSARWA